MTLWLWLGGIALVLISVGVTLSIMNAPIEPATPALKVAAPTKPVVTPPVAAALPEPTPDAQPTLPPAPTIAAAEVASTPAPAPVVATPQPAQPVATATPPSATPAATPSVTPVAAMPAPAATAALPPLYAPRPPSPVNPSARIQNFIDRLRVTGIRLSDKGTKVILGDRLFTIGEVVDNGLELRLIKAEQGVLTFSDANGKTYIKLF